MPSDKGAKVRMKIRHPLIELTITRLKEFLRESEAIFWVFVFPILMTLALGFAFSDREPDRVPVGVVDGPAAKARIHALAKSPALLPRLVSETEGREELRRGNVSLVVTSSNPPQYLYDPTRPEARTARIEVDDALQSEAGRKNAYEPGEVHVIEQGSRYIDFLVPGLIGMNLMGTGMWSIGFSIVNARLRKLLKRLAATPMRKSQYLLAQFLARFVFLVLEVGVLLLFAWFVFDVRIHGSLALLALICVVGGAAFAGIGLLVASRVRTIEAVSGLMNFVMLPMWVASGVFFSYDRFPEAAKPFIRALPLTALTDALRAVMNDGMGLVAVAPQLANLTIWAIVSYAIGLKIFRWQ